MTNGLIGKKIGMTQLFDKAGNVVPVTIIEAGPCKILEIKDEQKKVTLAFEEVSEKKCTKPQLGIYKKLNLKPHRTVKEFVNTQEGEVQLGQDVTVNIFRRGDCVDVSGTSIGKGFQGGMKRWNWSGGPAGHGSRHHRRVGSIGASADPARTLRGTNMPGQMGSKKTTVQNLRVHGIDEEKNLIFLKGAVPGATNGTLVIRLALKKGFKDLDKVIEVVKHKVNPMKQSKAKGKG